MSELQLVAATTYGPAGVNRMAMTIEARGVGLVQFWSRDQFLSTS